MMISNLETRLSKMEAPLVGRWNYKPLKWSQIWDLTNDTNDKILYHSIKDLNSQNWLNQKALCETIANPPLTNDFSSFNSFRMQLKGQIEERETYKVIVPSVLSVTSIVISLASLVVSIARK